MIQGPKGLLVIFDYTVSLLAIVANCLVLQSVLRVHFDLTGYRRFLISLAASDLYMCGVNILNFSHATLLASNTKFDQCGADFLRSLQFVGFFANLFNLCGMSFDHFIGIVYPLRYRDFMSKRTTQIAVVVLWVASFVLGFADFPVATTTFLTHHYNPQPETPQNQTPNLPGSNDLTILKSQNFESIVPDLQFGQRENNQSLFSRQSLPFTIMKQPLFSKSFGVSAGSTDHLAEPQPLTPSPFNLLKKSPISDISSFFANSGLIKNDSFSNQTHHEGQGPGNGNIEQTLYKAIITTVQEKDEGLDWCTFYLRNKMWLEFCVMTLALTSFVFLVICYGRIFREVFSNIGPSQRNTRKLVITTFILLGTFTVCWVPFMAFEFLMILVLRFNNDPDAKTLAGSTGFLIVHNIFNSLLMCYPLLDPVIYAARMRVIRRQILTRYGRYLPCCQNYIQQLAQRRASVFSYGIPRTSQDQTRMLAGTNNKQALAENTRNNSKSLFSRNDVLQRFSSFSGNSVKALSDEEGGGRVMLANNRNSNTYQSTAGTDVQDLQKPKKWHRKCTGKRKTEQQKTPPRIYQREPELRNLQIKDDGFDLIEPKNDHKKKDKDAEKCNLKTRSVGFDGASHQMFKKEICEKPTTEENKQIDETNHCIGSRLKSHSSYQLPYKLTDDMSPKTSSEEQQQSKDSLLCVNDNDPTRSSSDSPSITSSTSISTHLPCPYPSARKACPCSEFANTQAVLDKFRDNSLRLFGPGSLGPDHSSTSATTTALPTPCSPSGSDDQQLASSSKTANNKPPFVRNIIGKSPTTGAFSSPCDDLLYQNQHGK